MSKTLKRVLIFFILLCVVALVVLLAEMLISGKKPADKDTEGGEPPVTSSESETPPSESETPSEASSTPPPSDTGTESETPSAPTGTEYEIELPDGSGRHVSVYVDEGIFRYEDQFLGAVFALKDTASGTAKIEIGFSVDSDAESLAPGLLELYLPDYKELDTSTDSIGNSGLTWQWVIAKDGSETYEAWLADSGDCVLLVVIDYKNAAQRDLLVEVLNTLTIS